MLLVTADVHERASGIPKLLGRLGVLVDVRPLPRGDYILGPETVVERKTVFGLHQSIQEGRFWNQIGKLRATGASPVLLIEGRSVFNGPVAEDGIRGLWLAVADLGITVIRSESHEDTAAWLFRIAYRRRDGAVRDRPVYAQKVRSNAVSPAEAALAAAPGVSTVTAKTVLKQFGSLRNLCEADLNDLQSLPGVGRKRAEAIQALIHEPWTAARSN